MATANSLDELRRRIGHGAAPGAFAALAEEHRRAGRLAEAVAVCRDGLERYPTYVSARVTLGRALLDMGDVHAALEELTQAVAQAPDNLAAARALASAQALAPERPEPPAASEAPRDAVATPDGTGEAADASLMEWLAEPDDKQAEAEILDVSFASEWHAPEPGAPLEAEAAADAVDAEAPASVPVEEVTAAPSLVDAWADTIYAPVAPAEAPVEASVGSSLDAPVEGAVDTRGGTLDEMPSETWDGVSSVSSDAFSDSVTVPAALVETEDGLDDAAQDPVAVAPADEASAREAPSDGAPSNEAPSDEAPSDEASARLDDWGGVALPGLATAAPAEAWGASVDAAVAEVFARAGGDGPSAAGAPTPVSGESSSLDTLQSLLEAIRARRSALAAGHSDVD